MSDDIQIKIKTSDFQFVDGELIINCSQNADIVLMPSGVIGGYSTGGKPFKLTSVRELVLNSFEQYVREFAE